MLNILYLYIIVQFTFGSRIINGEIKSKLQEYRAFFNGPEKFYQEKQMTNVNSQKWYYSSNQQPIAYSWFWTNQDAPSSNFYKNSLSFNQNDQLGNWNCGRSRVTNRFARIMGGQDAVPHSYPWMVSLAKRSLNNLHLCGGALITRRHVLTAAHCMEDFDGVTDLFVVAGIHYITDKRNPTATIAISIHPQYDSETFANDIAIITLATSFPDNDPRISTICLPPDDEANKMNSYLNLPAVAIGWGSTSFGGEPSTTLKQVVLPILDVNKWPCNIYVTYAPGEICAGELSGGVDTCQADSGGPLMIETSDGRWEIIGITSFGKSCGRPNTPGIYTRVSTYNSFIRSIISLSKHSSYYSCSSKLKLFNYFIFSIISLIVFFF